MLYRFVKVATYYKEYLDDFYLRHPDISTMSYSEHMDEMLGEAFGWADFFSKNLRKLGVEAHEICANAEPLQETWTKENGITAKGKAIVIAQLKALKPDVVMFQDSFTFNGEWIKYLKEQIPSIRLVIGNCCSPYSKECISQFKYFDFMVTCTPSFVEKFKSQGINSCLIYHGFEDTLLPRIEQDNNYSPVDLIFMGSIESGKGFHNLRRQVIEKLLELGVNIHIHSFLRQVAMLRLIASQGLYITAKTMKLLGLKKLGEHLPVLKGAFFWPELPKRPSYNRSIREAIQSPVYGLEMFKSLYRAKIGFNIHIDAAGEYAGNIRLFETTGVGSCLVTDWKKNLPDLFELDKEIVTYKTAEECVEKVKWLLNHREEREEIARNGQKRTLKDHTFLRRAEQLNKIIMEKL